VTTSITIVAAFLAGAIAAVLVLLRMGMASEKPDTTLSSHPPTRSAAATRRVVGLYVQTPRSAGQPDHGTDRTSTAWDLGPSTTAADR
jgi:hypothetical protein